jgi:hypothetical protein
VFTPSATAGGQTSVDDTNSQSTDSPPFVAQIEVTVKQNQDRELIFIGIEYTNASNPLTT